MSDKISVVLLLSASILWGSEATKLQCDGTYDNYESKDVREVPLKGIYVEISGDMVKIFGAPGFDAAYSIISRRENGIGFRLKSDSSYGGYLNRYSGQMSVSEKGIVAADGSYKMKQLISAVCHKAKPLF